MNLQKHTICIIGILSASVSSHAAESTHVAAELENKALQFQQVVSHPSVPVDREIKDPIRIALIYPSADISDFWVKNYQAMVKRLKELNIPFVADEYSSRQIEHALQTTYVDDVLKAKNTYDYVIFGPSELGVQSNNIQRLSASNDFKTFIWAFHTPDPDWYSTPDVWFDFSSSLGAKALCQSLIKELGEGVLFALNRGIPGITDNQRSGEFSDCVENNGDWINAYEHFGQYQKTGGADGAKLITKNFPEITMLHNANTAMTIGALEALENSHKLDDIFLTGWGGTEKEIQLIKQGKLNATPMRMSDDLGVATAEAMKYYLEGKMSAIPTIYLGRITVVSSKMPPEDIDKLSAEAFRYSGQ